MQWIFVDASKPIKSKLTTFGPPATPFVVLTTPGTAMSVILDLSVAVRGQGGDYSRHLPHIALYADGHVHAVAGDVELGHRHQDVLVQPCGHVVVLNGQQCQILVRSAIVPISLSMTQILFESSFTVTYPSLYNITPVIMLLR
ncbi:hypothetical protein FNYG_14842 [Fusarium nygamai]|uniref:Uncharacterized protein n=1 Tax=Gibberella nygamai TaxID=42673 RepID=A0A2K0UPK9_GIBNY|nr:hypothetical protein FNYG_14842 [Fusarium nygamai]